MAEDSDQPLIGRNYEAQRDGSWADIWRHFTTRGHKGRVSVVDASSWAEYIITGGVDYTVRVWKFNARFEAYDLVVMTQMAIPEDLRQPTSFKLWKAIKDAVLPPKVDWEKALKEKPRGVSAIVCTQSPHPECPGLLRNGPILSGNVHGDLYVTDVCRARGDPMPPVKLGLHKGKINDIIALDAGDEGRDRMIIMTASEDGTAKLLRMELAEVPAPNFQEHTPHEPEGFAQQFVDLFFQGGGGRKAARLRREEEEAEWKADMEIDREDVSLTCTALVELDALCEHPSPVSTVRTVGERALDDGRACFATCCQEFVCLWDMHGNLKTKLWLHTSQNFHRYTSKKMLETESVSAERLTGVATVNKPHGTLLFASGMQGDVVRVGVWGIMNGVVGVRSEEYDGTMSAGLRPTVARGHQAVRASTALRHDDLASAAMGEEPEKGRLPPLAVYHQEGTLLDVDQAGYSTTFAVQLLRDQRTVNMWDLEVIETSALIVEPTGVAGLLPCPGYDHPELQMSHGSRVTDMRVVEDSDGPALITATDDAAAYIWDLEGDDRGQVYGELRSMKPLEIVLPVVMLFVTFSQVFSFAFGPAVPWKKDVHKDAVVLHNFMMLDFKKDIKIPKEDIFWPEMTIITSAMLCFLLFAMIDAPHLLDAAVLRASQVKHPLCGPIARFISGNARSGCYALMSLLSTVLVVPMIQSCAQAVDCTWDENLHIIDVLAGRYTVEQCYLADIPTVQCYHGPHLKLLLLLVFVVPPYLACLLPYAVCQGDAQYINFTALWDYKFWQHENAWQLAAKRKATDKHLGFLHPVPTQAFTTQALELIGKIALPVITTWTTQRPMLQMLGVSFIGGVLWATSIVWSPYVERKWCVLVQSLKLVVFLAMITGVVTVGLNDVHSWLPIYLLVGFLVSVFISFLIQWFSLQVESVDVIVFDHDARKAAGDEEQEPLVDSNAREVALGAPDERLEAPAAAEAPEAEAAAEE